MGTLNDRLMFTEVSCQLHATEGYNVTPSSRLAVSVVLALCGIRDLLAKSE